MSNKSVGDMSVSFSGRQTCRSRTPPPGKIRSVRFAKRYVSRKTVEI